MGNKSLTLLTPGFLAAVHVADAENWLMSWQVQENKKITISKGESLMIDFQSAVPALIPAGVARIYHTNAALEDRVFIQSIDLAALPTIAQQLSTDYKLRWENNANIPAGDRIAISLDAAVACVPAECHPSLSVNES